MNVLALSNLSALSWHKSVVIEDELGHLVQEPALDSLEEPLRQYCYILEVDDVDSQVLLVHFHL